MSARRPSLLFPHIPCVWRQYGAGLIEFTIVVLPVLMLGLGSVEISHWLYTRQAISLALLEAGRAAITDHNRPSRITSHFEAALRPLYAAPSADITTLRLRNALSDRQRHLNAAPWQIEVLSPSAQAYSDFTDSTLRIDGASGRPAINNHYLAEQDARYREQGWPQGLGPVSGQTIYEANTLVLRLSWPHKPHLPFMTPLLRAIGNAHGNYRQRALSKGYLPMTRQITMLMQSHPVHWADEPTGRVIYRTESPPAVPVCRGWLCASQASALAPAPVPDPTPAPGLPPAHNGNPDNLPPAHDTTPGSLPPSDPALPLPDPDDPMCGITLCCL